MDMLWYTSVEYNYLETLAKTFIIPARQKQFIHEIIFNQAPIGRIAIAIIIISALSGFYTEKPFWYQKLDLRQIRIFSGSQPIVESDGVHNCRL